MRERQQAQVPNQIDDQSLGRTPGKRTLSSTSNVVQRKAADGPAAKPAPTYTVKAHDTLWGIAGKELGNERRYMEIFQLNRDKIQDPNLILPGQVLKLPEKAEPPKVPLQDPPKQENKEPPGQSQQAKTQTQQPQTQAQTQEPAKGGVSFTYSEFVKVELGFSIPIWGPIKLEGKFSGGYTHSPVSPDGAKTEVEGKLYFGAVADFIFFKFSIGIEGAGSFTVIGTADPLEAIRKGANEFINYQMSQKVIKELAGKKADVAKAFDETRGSVTRDLGEMRSQVDSGKWGDDAGEQWFGAAWFAKNNRTEILDSLNGLSGRISGIFREFDATADVSSLNIGQITGLLNQVSSAPNKSTALGKLNQLNTVVGNSLAQGKANTVGRMDSIVPLKNDPTVGFKLSGALKIGAKAEASKAVSVDAGYSLTYSVEDKVVSEADRKKAAGTGPDAEKAKQKQEGWQDVKSGWENAGSLEVKVAIKDAEIAVAGTVNDKGDWSIAVKVSGKMMKWAEEFGGKAPKGDIGGVLSAMKALKGPGELGLTTLQAFGKTVGDLLTKQAEHAAKSPSTVKGNAKVGAELKFKFKKWSEPNGGTFKITFLSTELSAEDYIGAAGKTVSGKVQVGSSVQWDWK